MMEVHAVPHLRTRPLPPSPECRHGAADIRVRFAANFRYVPLVLPRAHWTQPVGRFTLAGAPVTEQSTMELGKLGVWVGMDGMSAAQAAAFAKRVEEWGYGALWIPESRGRNALVHSSWLLSHTERLIVATGIANIYARDPM